MRSYSISGFGGSYEWGCQCMLQRGVEWLKSHPTFSFHDYHGYKGIYGVVSADTADAKNLDEYLLDEPTLKAFGATGAMHQAVIWHLAFIHHQGIEKWHEEMSKHRTGDQEVYKDYDIEALRPKLPENASNERSV